MQYSSFIIKKEKLMFTEVTKACWGHVSNKLKNQTRMMVSIAHLSAPPVPSQAQVRLCREEVHLCRGGSNCVRVHLSKDLLSTCSSTAPPRQGLTLKVMRQGQVSKLPLLPVRNLSCLESKRCFVLNHSWAEWVVPFLKAGSSKNLLNLLEYLGK